MTVPRQLWLCVTTVLLVLASADAVQAQARPEPQQSIAVDQLWADFNHYVLIARADLAQAAATVLTQEANEDDLLIAVESGGYPNWHKQIDRGLKMDGLSSDVVRQLGDRIQQAKVKHSRDPQRIRDDIRKLAEGARARMNATDRLRAAGQFAAPDLLATLLDDTSRQLHPFIMAAMVAIGRPMVDPLSVAIPELEPVTMGQVAQVLAEIGYSKVTPYLRQVLESETIDPDARSVVQSAFDRLAQKSGLPANVAAAELFLTLGQNLYRAQTQGQILPGFDAASGNGIVWEYSKHAGLVAISVPGEIFGDVLAMRAADTALRLSPELDPALSLWLMANLRRENALPDDAADLSYRYKHAPVYYLMAAGPLRQHDVLEQALGDADAKLALDAIAALDATAGTDALVRREGTAQPLLRALSFPDRRVRYKAAEALTNARPKEPFPGSHRVVPALAEAARESNLKFAAIVAESQPTLNMLAPKLKDLGYRSIGGLSLDELSEQISGGPGIDLIVTNLSADQFDGLYRDSEHDYNLAAVPIIAIVSAEDQSDLKRRFRDHHRLHTVDTAEIEQDLESAIAQARSEYDTIMSSEEAQHFALRALSLLREVAVGEYDVFNVADAKPSLLQALDDDRQPIVTRAAEVLALIDETETQQAIAESALDDTRATETRIALLGSLAESATYFGGHLTVEQLEMLLDLVTSGQGELAVEAGRAHGALTQPTDNVVQLITSP